MRFSNGARPDSTPIPFVRVSTISIPSFGGDVRACPWPRRDEQITQRTTPHRVTSRGVSHKVPTLLIGRPPTPRVCEWAALAWHAPAWIIAHSWS